MPSNSRVLESSPYRQQRRVRRDRQTLFRPKLSPGVHLRASTCASLENVNRVGAPHCRSGIVVTNPRGLLPSSQGAGETSPAAISPINKKINSHLTSGASISPIRTNLQRNSATKCLHGEAQNRESGAAPTLAGSLFSGVFFSGRALSA